MVVLVSTYELGRQPFGLASPAAWLREAGHEVVCLDVSRRELDPEIVRRADVVGFYLPMHTATRLALPLIDAVRRLNPAARLCAYGLYAPLNAALLGDRGIVARFGGEFEADLTAFVAGERVPDAPPASVPRLEFRRPDRTDLPPLTQYSSLVLPDGARRVVGSTDASRGCKHLCRHCPIVPVYDGQFRVVAADVVMGDVRALVEQGAQHISFGDPDFFNGIRHARRIVDRLAREHPGLTYDVTIKIEHLLRHAEHLPRLAETGCLFVTSAVESIDDEVLTILDKGHTRQDFFDAVARCRAAGLNLVPTFVPFNPWTTLEDYRELLDVIQALDLVGHVAPVQLAIRLLLPEGSRLLEVPSVRAFVGPFDREQLVYPWSHPDPRLDQLHRDVSALVGAAGSAPRGAVFEAVRAQAGAPAPTATGRWPSAVPYIDEPWYCCAEPLEEQGRLV